MFGDVGHGGVVLILGLLMALRPNVFPKSIAKMRSLVLLMGFFSTYCGIIYNEFFAVAIPITDSCY